MRLTRRSELAIGILVTCARRPDRQWRIQQVATAIGITKVYAAQVVAALVRGGFLKTERGRRGGLTLTLPPDDIALGVVLRHIQPELPASGDSVDPHTGSGNASFDMVVEAATANFFRLMDRFTLADLISGRSFGRIACLDCTLVNPGRPTPISPQHGRGPTSSAMQDPATLTTANAADTPNRERPPYDDVYHPR